MASFHHAVANWLGSAWVGASGGNRPGCSSPSFLSVPVRLGTVAATQRIASANFAATVASCSGSLGLEVPPGWQSRCRGQNAREEG
jgi:hypothetical protein